MLREKMLEALGGDEKTFDFVVIGGGATGIGVALEASARGYTVLLLEKSDFTKSTSSKSTKLVHGGVRYLAQGDISLVREAVIERGRLNKNAPHLVKNQSFIIPTHGLWDEVLYTVGLTFYDMLAGKYSLGRSKRISKSETLRRLSTINEKKISAGVQYKDGQFDDSRLAINSLQTAVEKGAIVLNYANVLGLLKDEAGQLAGVTFRNEENGEEYKVKAKQVVNATGVFADDILQMDEPGAEKTIAPSQGVHLMLDRSFLPGDDAIMIPKTDDGRVLFLVPWHDKVVVGTTDTSIKEASLEPVALEEEIEFILRTSARYLNRAPQRSDVLSVFAGLRPLAAPKADGKSTKEISRSHKIIASKSGMLTMVGGKWTTYRKMGEDMVDKAEKRMAWKHKESMTKNLKIHGYRTEVAYDDPLYFYGTDKENIEALAKEKGMDEVLCERLQVTKAMLVWAVREEMAMSVEDFLARRSRCQLLDAKESMKMAARVAEIMAEEMGRSAEWVKEQVEAYVQVTKGYVLGG